MKTEYKHIHFVNVSSAYPKRKTQTWDCRNNSGVFLGIVYWNCKWRQYCFYIKTERIFSAGCLHDIIDFINNLHAERNAERRKHKEQISKNA